MAEAIDLKPAAGRLGILTPGMGAVATTTYAGVLAVRQEQAMPFGSLTQMGRIRLGKRTEDRNPPIRDFVPLAGLGDLVFGGWDPFSDNAFEAAVKAGKTPEQAMTEFKLPEKLSAAGFTYAGGGRGGPGGNIGIIMEELKTAK